MTLLSICQQVANEAGVTAPSAIVGSVNPLAVRLLAAAQTSGRALASGRVYDAAGRLVLMHDWSALRREHTFTTVSGTASYTPPASLLRIVTDTAWDRTNDRVIRFVDESEWSVLKGLELAAAVFERYMILREGYTVMHPTPTVTGDTIAYEYVSNQWARSSGGTAQALWAADTDTTVLPEELFMLDVKWRFLQAQGLPYAEERAEALAAFQGYIRSDRVARTLYLGSIDTDGIFERLALNIPRTGLG